MLEHIASKIDPIYGNIATVLVVLAGVAIVLQLFIVKRKQWDAIARLPLEERDSGNTAGDHDNR